MSHVSGKPFEITGKHVLIGMLTFFGLIIAVNIVMIRLALSTHTGVVAENTYRKGVKYNEEIAAAERMDLLGWRNTMALAPTGDKLSIDIRDKDGKAVKGLAIKATLGRPASEKYDLELTLNETADGTYEAAIPARDSGTYVASIEAIDPAREQDGVLYRAKERLWLKP
jgi:nitrogen fixation protein FixH